MKARFFPLVTAILIFGLVGCGEEPSNPVDSEVEDYCEIISTNPLIIESVEGGYFSKTSFVLDDGMVVRKSEFQTNKAAERACSKYADEGSYGKVVCRDKVIVATGDEEMSSEAFSKFKQKTMQECEDFDAKHRGVVKSSSSSVTRSSSSNKSSSSVAKSSSSSAKQSSSSSEVTGEKISWVGDSWYRKEKVVAANIDELDCEDNKNVDELNEFSVAYEFNDPSDLGRDYLGNNNAYLDGTVHPVTAECGSVVFDGSNGLLIPLDDVFKSEFFVVEVRFMPTKEADIGNLIAAEPPGRGVDGWQIRLNGTEVVFVERDANSQSDWVYIEIGEVSVNEWHTIRVKIAPSDYEEGAYRVNVILDGALRYTQDHTIDLSNLKYGLGIAYDAMHQNAYSRKFFTGKIDYIRYGKN